MKDISGTRCNIPRHTSIDTDDYTIETMKQKLNYYKALQIAASLTPRQETKGLRN